MPVSVHGIEISSSNRCYSSLLNTTSKVVIKIQEEKEVPADGQASPWILVLRFLYKLICKIYSHQHHLLSPTERFISATNRFLPLRV